METLDTPNLRPAPADQAYTGSWLSIKLGIGPRELDRRRRAGELLAQPVGRGTEYVYPAWQFDAAGRPLPEIAEIVRVARERGLSDAELVALLLRRDGLTGAGRLFDSLREGRSERVLAAIRGA